MTTRPLWERCIYHLGKDVEKFLIDHFGNNDRHIRLIGGAGFDPRASIVSRLLAQIAPGRAKGLFIREQRPTPDGQLVQKASENEAVLRELLIGSEFYSLDIFASDNAVVGGRTAVNIITQTATESFTDIVVDLSALSIGVAFPIIRFLYEKAQTPRTNLHLVVVDEPATDTNIKSTPTESPTTIHGFKGGWELDASSNAARLWLPQLSMTKKAALNLIHGRVLPHAVCPILPFPATVPRLADSLIELYGELFQSASSFDAQISWQVDARDMIYASERSPVDLYRTILRIDDARTRVFAETGGSQIILSPVGSKALAIGALMAALERPFTIMYIESLGYSVDFEQVRAECERDVSQLVHVWLRGEAYGTTNKEAKQHEA